MKQNLKIAILMTLVTTVLLGIIYPLVVTGLAQVMFHDKANGQLITRHGEIVGSRIIGQAFAAPGYLHSRPSAAGNGYDAANSGRHQSCSHQPKADRSRECRRRTLAGGESGTAGSDRSGDYLGFGIGSRHHSCGSRIPGAARWRTSAD